MRVEWSVTSLPLKGGGGLSCKWQCEIKSSLSLDLQHGAVSGLRTGNMNTQSETVRQLNSQTVRQSDSQTVRLSDSQIVRQSGITTVKL